MADLRRRTLSDTAYEHTKDRILEGALPPGEWVRVEDVAGRLRMSRQPVMDAFRRLSVEGFIDIVPQVGSRVALPEPTEMADFFRLFAMAEGLTAELAAGRATAPEIAELQRIHAEIGRVFAAGLPVAELAPRYRQLNRAFHGQIHAMAHSRLVSDVAESNWDRSDFYIATAASKLEVFARSVEAAQAQHAEILAAIAAGDDRAALAATQAHMLAFGRAAVGPNAGPNT